MWSGVWVLVATRRAWIWLCEARLPPLASSLEYYLSYDGSAFSKVPDFSCSGIRLCPTLQRLPIPRLQSTTSTLHLNHPNPSVLGSENVYRPMGCCTSAAVPALTPQLPQHLVFPASASSVGGRDHAPTWRHSLVIRIAPQHLKTCVKAEGPSSEARQTRRRKTLGDMLPRACNSGDYWS